MKTSRPSYVCNVLYVFVSWLLIVENNKVNAFSISFGLGSLLFQPRGLRTKAANGEPQTILQASDFFVDAFWVGKVGGGTSQLNDKQRTTLSSSQFVEFRGRYSGISRGKAELVTCELGRQVVGCVGIEVSPIPDGYLKGPAVTRAPLLSNLAVSRGYRRRGIGELLVKEAERIAKQQWGQKYCYLYVEEINAAAVKLYKKLGYKVEWIDDDAKTLLPTSGGGLRQFPTKILCMKKRLGGNLPGLPVGWPF